MSRYRDAVVQIMPVRAFAVAASLLAVVTHAEGEILVQRLEDGNVSVRYDLPENASELRFFVDSPTIRSDYWHLDTALLELQPDMIVSPRGATFSHAAVTLIPNDRPFDRVYPSLIAFDGNTSLVNIDYIRLRNGFEEVPITIQNAYDPYEKACVASYSVGSRERHDLPSTAGRYVFFGTRYEDCAAASKAGAVGIFVSDEAPAALVDVISGAFIPTYERLRQGFGIPIRPEPTIFASHDRTATFRDFQADAGWDSVISLRLFGSAWDAFDDASSIRILSVLTHELVHLWIGKSFEIAGQPARAWLHEGAAEYIALRDLLRQGWISHDDFRATLERNLAGCSSGLEAMSLMTERAPQGGRQVYDCGVLVQFVYDIVTHSESSAQRTVVDLWRELMSASLEEGTRTLTAEEFVATSATAREIVSSVLYGPKMNMPLILEALQEFGVDAALEEATAVDTVMMALLSTFYRADCESGPWGFYLLEDHLALDVNDTCRAIPDGFVLRYVQDVDVLEEASGALKSVSVVCAEDGVVRMSGRTPEEPEVTLQCPGSLPEHPVIVIVRELPGL